MGGVVVGCVGVAPSGSVSFVLRPRGHHHLLASKVPEGRHMEGHVGEHHHVLTQRKQRVDWGGEGDSSKDTHTERKTDKYKQAEASGRREALLKIKAETKYDIQRV